MALVGLLALALTAAAAQALPLLLGPAYAGLTGLATGLALACPLVALQYPAADALTAAGRQGLRTLLYGLGALASAALLAGGALAAGPAGAVAGFVAAQGTLAAALWLAFARCCR
jgi:O-antigen/teichoic acid export membrane protein